MEQEHEDMPKSITKKGAFQASAALDRIATLIQMEHTSLGIPEKVASDFAHRCDLLADRIERTAGLVRDQKGNLKNADFNPSEIGVEKAGPLEGDSDESYMRGEFSQQERRELREEVESGNIAAPDLDPQPANPGVQANFKALLAALKSAKLTPAGAAKAAKALELATGVIKSSSDDEDEDDEKDAGKKAGSRWASDGEDEDDEKDAGKKASHGFNLFS